MGDEHADPTTDLPREEAGEKSAKEVLKELMAKRDTYETELQDALTALKTTPAGLDQPLQDKEGFPRADCDLHMVTKFRQRVVVLRNDLKSVMEEIQDTLFKIHEDAKADGTVDAKEVPKKTEADEDAETAALLKRYADYPAFLQVGSVLGSSPAAEAGLQENDYVVSWQGITMQHPNFMTQIAQLTQRHEDKEMTIVVRRSDILARITLVPKKWSGKGLLGCVLNKMK